MLEIGYIYDDLLCIRFEGKNKYNQNMYLMPINTALNKYKDRTIYKDWQFEYLVD